MLLDAGPLGRLAHPKPDEGIKRRLRELLASRRQVIVPAVADYEIRRSFLLHENWQSLERLNELCAGLDFQPILPHDWMLAAHFWADSRRQGQPTAHPHELDCDVILAALARRLGGIVATENVGHLSRFVEAKHWREIS